MKSKKLFSLLTIILALSFCVLPSALAETWETIYSYYLPNSYGTFVSDNFTCDCPSWRISYSFGVPDGGAWLTITTYDAITNDSIDEFRDGYQWRNLQWRGTRMFGSNGTFYMVIKAENLYLYPKIEVQQDIDSIPEFPSVTILLIAMVIITTAVILGRRKLALRQKT